MGDSFYGFNLGKPEPRNGVFFNKRILQENGYDPDYPYDLQKAGKWTWDTFEEMCKKLTRDTDNDGVIDQYAMASFNTEFSYSALDSNGAKIIDRDANGKYINVAGSEKAMEAWNWIQHMFLTYQLPQEEGENWDYFYTAFTNGEVAFLADQEYNAQPNGKFWSMADDYGFVCFPLGPHGDGKYKMDHLQHSSELWFQVQNQSLHLASCSHLYGSGQTASIPNCSLVRLSFFQDRFPVLLNDWVLTLLQSTVVL